MYEINTLLKLIIESEASDLFISMAAYPMLKIKGKMIGLKESK